MLDYIGEKSVRLQ